MRCGKTNNVFLEDIFREQLSKFNCIHYVRSTQLTGHKKISALLRCPRVWLPNCTILRNFFFS